MRSHPLASLLRSRRRAWLASVALSILWLALSGANNVAIGQCDVVPTSLDFDHVCLSSVYLDKDFTITNSGAEPLSVNVTHPGPFFSVIVGGGSYTLDPGEWQTVTVRFQPDPGILGLLHYSSTIETGNELCSDVGCLGTGGKCCGVTTQDGDPYPMSLSFGEVLVGDSRVKWMGITNYDPDNALSGNVSESCEHFEIDSGEGPFTLPDYLDGLPVMVRFQPESAGTHYCQIETGNPICANVQCVGTGVEVPMVPTASRGGLIAMTLMLLTTGWILVRRRHRTSH